jgi:hypothetical protein
MGVWVRLIYAFYEQFAKIAGAFFMVTFLSRSHFAKRIF